MPGWFGIPKRIRVGGVQSLESLATKNPVPLIRCDSGELKLTDATHDPGINVQ